MVYLLFFLSGLTSLVYEVIWGRQFGLVFGVTTYAVSTVLAAFFAGLALGSYLAGRLIDRTRIHPLVIYGVMEGVVGLCALLLPMELRGIEATYPSLYSRFGESFTLFTLYRFALCFVVLVIPTTLMGATLPVLSKLMVEQEATLGLNVGRLYAVNTFGAVAGAFSAGFVLIKTFGVTHTTFLTAMANLLLGAAAISLSFASAFAIRRRQGAEEVGQRDTEDGRSQRERRRAEKAGPGETLGGRAGAGLADKAVLALAFTSGLAALALEVVWTKSLILVLGSTTYAFSTMLTAVLVGIAAGSAVFARWADPARNRAAVVAFLMFTGGLCAALGLLVINWLPFAYLRMEDWMGGSWTLHIVLQFVICFLLVFVPTFLSGASFPILVRMHSRGMERVGRTVADVYAVNTLGGIIGSLAGGFVLVRFLGLERSLVSAALFLMVVGGPLAISLARPWSTRTRGAIGAVMLCVVVLTGVFHPRLNTKLLFGGWGPFGGGYYLGRGGGTTVDITDRYMERLLYHKEGVSAAVDVFESALGDKIISINAQTVASTYLYDMRALRMLGHLPVLLHPDPKDALLIGLGAGVSTGIIASYPSLEQVTVVELNEEVPAGAARFDKWNFDVVNNPKVKIVINDGANYVKAVRKQYDIISSDPIHPFILGNGILYSVDHWKVCRDRLREGGILAQWIPLYQLSAEDFACIVRSFREVFPNATMWYSGIDVVLIGANVEGNLQINPERVAKHMRDQTIADDLESMGAYSVGDVLGWYVAGPDQLADMSRGAAINRVERPVLEYTAPKALALGGVSATVPALINAADTIRKVGNQRALEEICTRKFAEDNQQDQDILQDAQSTREAGEWIMWSQVRSSYEYYDRAVEACREALKIRPDDKFLKEALADALVPIADGQQSSAAIRTYREAHDLDPSSVGALTGAMFAALQLAPEDLGQMVELVEVTHADPQLTPNEIISRALPSLFYARVSLEVKIIPAKPGDQTAMEIICHLPFASVKSEEWERFTPSDYALRIFEVATPTGKLDPSKVFRMQEYKGLAALKQSDLKAARKAFEDAGKWGQDQPHAWSQESPTMHIGLGMVALREGRSEGLVASGCAKQREGDLAEALDDFSEAHALDPGNVNAIAGGMLTALQVGENQWSRLLKAHSKGSLTTASGGATMMYSLPFAEVTVEPGKRFGPADYAKRILGEATGPQKDSSQLRECGKLIELSRSEPDQARGEARQSLGRISGTAPAMQRSEKQKVASARRHFDRGLAVATTPIDALYDIVDLSSSAHLENDTRSYAQDLVTAAAASIAEDPGRPNFYKYRALANTALGDKKAAAQDRATADSLRGCVE